MLDLQGPVRADLAERSPANPLLLPADIAPSSPTMRVECLLNPGAFRFAGKTWLLVRVAERPEQTPGWVTFPVLDEQGQPRVVAFSHDDPKLDLSDPRIVRHDGVDYLSTLSHLRLVCSDDGTHFAEAADYPVLGGEGPLEIFGIEDCRVAEIAGTYYLTYTQVSPHGVGVGLRSTTDWQSFAHHGMIFPPHNKDCALFTERVGDRYYALHRPSSPALGGNYIWLAESPDLLHWGNHRCLARTRPGMWDCQRVGAGAAPIRTERGWLEIYHGADDDNRYCLGALLLDLADPGIVLARSVEPIMEPVRDYEREGFFGNVVFTNGHLVDGDDVTIYYGASDTSVCSATVSIRQVLATLTGEAR